MQGMFWRRSLINSGTSPKKEETPREKEKRNLLMARTLLEWCLTSSSYCQPNSRSGELSVRDGRPSRGLSTALKTSSTALSTTYDCSHKQVHTYALRLRWGHMKVRLLLFEIWGCRTCANRNARPSITCRQPPQTMHKGRVVGGTHCHAWP